MGLGHGGCARVTPKRMPPNQVSRTWGLRSGHAQAHATQPGLPDLVVARPSRGLDEGRYGICLRCKGDS